jgi:hypothetical protein
MSISLYTTSGAEFALSMLGLLSGGPWELLMGLAIISAVSALFLDERF